MSVAVGISFAIAFLQASGISGNLPVGVGPLQERASAVWLPADQSPDDERRECTLTTATRWDCPTVSAGESGVVVFFGDRVVGYVAFGRTGLVASGSAEWGRLVRVGTGGTGGDVIANLRLSSWQADRPLNRPNTQKLDVVPDESVQVLRLSDTSFWVSGQLPSADAFLRLEGDRIARHDTGTLRIAEGASDSPFAIDATSPVSISGRVETRSGEPIEGALVELFTKVPGVDVEPGNTRSSSPPPVIRLADVVSDPDGQFEFTGLDEGAYQVVATAFSQGRLARWTTTTNPPLLMKLTPPATVTGRVVRRKLPAPDVKVRFVPGSAAWRNSVDPTAHLAADTLTDDAGRFRLALPPEPSGDVQFIGPDGASTRFSVPAIQGLSEIAIGDVELPEPLSIEIRADVAGCRMTAVGPAGALGLAVVQGQGTSTIYQFDLPESGEWFLDAECSGRHVSIQPTAIQVKAARAPRSFDVHVVTTDNNGASGR